MDALTNNQPTTTSRWALALTNAVLLLMITCVSSIAIYLMFFYKPKLDPDYTAKLARVAGDRVNSHVDVIGNELTILGRETWPILEEALVEQARADYPKIAQTLQSEGSIYFNNVETAFLAKVKARYHDYLMQHRKILTSEFPEHATRENVQRVVVAFEATFGELIERYYLDQFRHEVSRTEQQWRSLRPARQPELDEPALEQQLAQVGHDWLLTITRPPSQ